MVLHLGDGWQDAALLQQRYPELPMEKVPGNCDYRYQEAPVRIVMIADKLIMLCHGHTLNVKSNLTILLREALLQKVDAVLFGHTHQPFVDIRQGVVMLNPGSIGSIYAPTYGTLTFRDGKCLPATHRLR